MADGIGADASVDEGQIGRTRDVRVAFDVAHRARERLGEVTVAGDEPAVGCDAVQLGQRVERAAGVVRRPTAILKTDTVRFRHNAGEFRHAVD